MVRRLLLGADGVALRARRDERDLDGRGRRAIAIEKTLPWRRVATYGTTIVLVVLGVIMLLAPDTLPGLTVPGQSPMPSM